MNRILAIILILILLPIWLLIYLIQWAVFGKAIFRQERTGKNLKLFTIYKFQTMKIGSEEIPPWGTFLRKSSLDETPQLVNILLGDMNFVGPRPLLPEYSDLYTEEQNKRHNVKPGITGWAQVNGRTLIKWEKQFEYDVWYVENKSVLLNLRIIWLTFFRTTSSLKGTLDRGAFTNKKYH